MMRSDNINRVITPVNTRYGAPMGRSDKGSFPVGVTRGNNGKMYKKDQPKIYNKPVHLIEGYDNGGAYWGCGAELRVEFSADLSYIRFYRIKS